MRTDNLFIMFALLVFSAAGAEPINTGRPPLTTTDPTMVIPMLIDGARPKIDGRNDPDEWRDSVQCAGFVDNESKTLVPGQKGFVRLCRDQDYLYLGIRTTTPNGDPGGGLTSMEKKRDGAVTYDDSVMIQITPEAGTIFQISMNAEGVVADDKREMDEKRADAAWDCAGLKIGSMVESGWWVLEVAIPLSEVGAPVESLRLNVFRNWSGIGASSLNAMASGVGGAGMFRIRWDERAVLWGQMELGTPESGQWAAIFEINNPSQETVTLSAQIDHEIPRKTSAAKPEGISIDAKKTIEIPPGQTRTITLKHLVEQRMTVNLSVKVFASRTGEVFYSRCVSGIKGAAVGRRPVTATFDLPEVGSGAVWYYPGFNRATCLLTCLPSADVLNVRFVVDRGAPVMATRGKDGFRASVPLGAEAGAHTISIQIAGHNGEWKVTPDVCRLTKKIFPWENNGLGKERVILPPFAALKVEKNTVSTRLSQFHVNSLGLWDSLLAQNREMLAAPMRLELMEDGRAQVWQGTTGTPEVRDGGYDVRFQTMAQATSGIRLGTEIVCEYDGFYWVKMKLENVRGHQIEHLKLVIPLKQSEVPFFHAVANAIRANPAGKIPQGQGEVWNASGLPRMKHFGEEILHSQFVPYLWVGGVENGLCWFADSSFGMKLDATKSAARMIRRDDRLELEIDLINRLTPGNEPIIFEFGLQATPVKQHDPLLRKLMFDSMGIGVKGMDRAIFVYNHQLGYPYTWAKLPFENDFSLFRSATETWMKGTFPNSAEMVRPWMEQYDKRVMEVMYRIPNVGDKPEKFRKTREGFRKQGFDDPRRGPSRPYLFTNPRLTYIMDEVPDYFKAEWWNPAAISYWGAWRTFPVPSQLDYLVYAYNEEMKNGMQGVYLDDCFLMPETNTDTVARIDDDGRLHARVGILALRELVKRISVLQHQHNLYPRILHVHMTNALLVPCFSFATGLVGFEMNYGDTPHPQRFSLDHIQAIGLGRQIGATSLIIPGIRLKQMSAEEQAKAMPRLQRAMLAFILPHDIRQMAKYDSAVVDVFQRMSDFGFWKENCQFVPYWEKEAALQVAEPDILLTSYRLPDKTLAVIANFSTMRKTIAVSVDYARLCMEPEAVAIDLESGKKINLDAIVVEDNNFRLIQISK